MDVLSMLIVQGAKKSLTRFFLEVMVRAAASEVGKAVVKAAGSAVKKLRQKITRWSQWEIVGIEIEFVEGA